MFDTILVPLDGTYLAERAVPYAVRLAQACDAQLVLYHWTPPLAVEHHPADEQAASLQLEAAAAAARERGVAAETVIDHVAHDDAAAAVIDGTRARLADLVVLASHGRSGVVDAVLGSAAERIARNAGVPVLLVPAQHDQPWAEDPDLRILLALDGSPASEVALGPVAALAERLAARVLVAHVVGPARRRTDAAKVTSPMVRARPYVDTIKDLLAEAGLRVEARVGTGHPTSAILRLATEWSADLIVVATHARRGLARLVAGSIAAEVMRGTAVPVLVIPPSGADATGGGASLSAPVCADQVLSQTQDTSQGGSVRRR